ncbi:hypothetical protein FSP39_020859 [Pinctada imbricata]|uniref:Uncharacterized protein n=1 Tax=Pinctada imbricata TaxID=66713 RepID=A0AA88Y1R3_PINIB|nr:hypothetical protein FSP39_020859 [Pinctada imbricata]
MATTGADDSDDDNTIRRDAEVLSIHRVSHHSIAPITCLYIKGGDRQQHKAAAPPAKPPNTQCKNTEQTSTGRDAKATDKRSLQKPILASETDLQKLAKLTANQLNNVAVQKQKVFSYSNVNGKEDRLQEEENKVINTDNGKVVSDVRQKSEKDSSSKVPHTQTKVDIPALGIHETVDSDKSFNLPRPEEVLDYDDAFRFTPSIVAEYLVQTGEFQQFDEALADLVNSSLMTPQQADLYKDNVRQEYNRIVQESNAMLANEALGNMYYPVSYDFPPIENEADINLNPETSDGEIYRLLGFSNIIPHLGIEELQSKEVMREAISRATSLIELIKTLMDEWLTRAIVTADPEAEKLLGDILKEVAKDNDPDDLSQMRDILYEFFANEVLNSLQKRPGSNMAGMGDIAQIPIPSAEDLKDSKTDDKALTQQTSEQHEVPSGHVTALTMKHKIKHRQTPSKLEVGPSAREEKASPDCQPHPSSHM